LKGISQYDQFSTVKETKKAESVLPNINPDFPNVFCIDKFLEVFWRNLFKLSNQFQYPCYFSRLLVWQTISLASNWKSRG